MNLHHYSNVARQFLENKTLYVNCGEVGSWGVGELGRWEGGEVEVGRRGGGKV